jgi:hypothetical protein
MQGESGKPYGMPCQLGEVHHRLMRLLHHLSCLDLQA